ncbi:MAG: response regulator transcription factor [Pyrinomonadaceae bacterium]|nr:response regulator transcription factor [Pyrinomonadaceae bacterium]
MIIRTLIVEDEPLARQALREFAAEFDWLAVIGEAADGRTAIDLINALQPDLVLLDVQIPEISGIEVINRAEHNPSIIFTTAYDNYALRAFELEAADYLLKPFGRARFKTAVERVRQRHAEKAGRLSTEQAQPPEQARNVLTRLFVHFRNSIVPLKIDDISRFEADDDYVKVFVGKQSYLIDLTLGEVESRLDSSRFCRVHRSTIVNLEFVERVETQDRRLLLILTDKTEIIASRSGSQALRKLIL